MLNKVKKTNLFIFCKYSVAGIFNTLVDLVTFFVMCDVLNFAEVTSNIAAYLCCATSSYLINSRYVYKENGYSLKRYFQFVTGNFLVLVISTAVIVFVSDFVELKLIAKLVAMPVTVLMNFTIQRFLIFRISADKQLNG